MISRISLQRCTKVGPEVGCVQSPIARLFVRFVRWTDHMPPDSPPAGAGKVEWFSAFGSQFLATA